jgi:hypothetical protein
MTVAELVNRFPEIPADLHSEPVLGEFAAHLGDLLAVARKPSNCAQQHDAANHFYLALIGPFATYGYGLLKRDKVLAKAEALIARWRANPEGFPASLLPANVAPQEVKGPGCR